VTQEYNRNEILQQSTHKNLKQNQNLMSQAALSTGEARNLGPAPARVETEPQARPRRKYYKSKSNPEQQDQREI
jgi:hypothetical protein